MSLNIAIVTTSVRQGRASGDVAKWVLDYALSRKEESINYQIVDLADYNLPILGSPFATDEQLSEIGRWSNKMAEFDAYIFVVAEYNHAFTGAIKNAMDFLKKEVANKVASFVAYGALGGARAVETFRMMFSELQVATTQKTVNFFLGYDFENFSVFKPKDHHIPNAEIMINQLVAWSKALKQLR